MRPRPSLALPALAVAALLAAPEAARPDPAPEPPVPAPAAPPAAAAPEASVAASAAQPQDPHRYAFPAMVRLAADSAGKTLEHRPGPATPANPATTVPVGDQARTAFATAAARMFAPATGGPPALVVEVAVGAAGLERRRGWQATIRHDVVVAAPGGEIVARWSYQGEEEVRGLGEGAIGAACARAARSAAEAFERWFDTAPEVGDWLLAHGWHRRSPPERAAGAPPPPRPAWNAYLDAGGGMAGGQVFALRAGLSGPWLYAQATFDRATDSFDASPFPAPGDLLTWVASLEAGGVARLGEHLEGRGGLGIGWLSATASMTDGRWNGSGAVMAIPKSGLVGDVSVALAYVSGPQTSYRGRGRLALEGRLYLGSDVRLDALDRTVTTGHGSILLLVGFELPASR